MNSLPRALHFNLLSEQWPTDERVRQYKHVIIFQAFSKLTLMNPAACHILHLLHIVWFYIGSTGLVLQKICGKIAAHCFSNNLLVFCDPMRVHLSLGFSCWLTPPINESSRFPNVYINQVSDKLCGGMCFTCIGTDLCSLMTALKQ